MAQLAQLRSKTKELLASDDPAAALKARGMSNEHINGVVKSKGFAAARTGTTETA